MWKRTQNFNALLNMVSNYNCMEPIYYFALRDYRAQYEEQLQLLSGSKCNETSVYKLFTLVFWSIFCKDERHPLDEMVCGVKWLDAAALHDMR